MSNNIFQFLDVKLTIINNKITTSVYIKPTNRGIYSPFNSHTLLSYKISTAKTLINRALKLSSNWQYFHSEIVRIKQVFANLDYPQQTIENIINKTLYRHFQPQSTEDTINSIDYYVHFIQLLVSKTIKNLWKPYLKDSSNQSIF